MDFFAALANLRATGDGRLAEAELALVEGEAAINRGVEAIARMVANDRAAAESGARLDWDYRIQLLEFYETQSTRDMARIRRLIDRLLAGAHDADRAIGRRARGLVRRQQDAVLGFADALRDARWQMMAMRANFDRDSGGGPIFDDPAEMRRYLAAS